tara:strand:- start:279 stop:719 length:441 start_codon:yes stop_codon:yes gene_type:complete
MLSFLTPEFLTLIGSSLTGFLFKYWSEKRQDQKELYERMLGRSKQSIASHDAAAERTGEAGKVIRRLIVVTILFGTIIAPFLLPFFGIPTVVEITELEGTFLGLFGGGEKITFHEVYGYLFTEQNRQILLTIVGFYFGQAVGKSTR